MPKRQRNSEKHSMFGHLLLKLGGGGDRHNALWKGVSKQERVHGGGAGEGGIAPPLEIGKKMLSEEILTSFTCVSLMKLRGGGDQHTLHTYKMEGGVGGQAIVHGGGEGALPPPPLENEKKRLSEEILSSFTYVLLMKLGGGGDYYRH